jgi:hypothetical protein
MTERRYKVHIRIHDVELDLEGPEEFIERYRDQWEPLLEMLPDLARGPPVDGWGDEEPLSLQPEEGRASVGAADGPLFAPFRAGLTDYDKVLIACYHAQQENEEHQFRWPEASRVAVANGLPTSDAAAEFQYLLDIRHVMRVKRGVYRVSAKGVEAIHRLMVATPPS